MSPNGCIRKYQSPDLHNATKEGGQLYFHRNSLLAGTFDDLRRGDEVYYVEEMADTGPVASKVRVRTPTG